MDIMNSTYQEIIDDLKGLNVAQLTQTKKLITGFIKDKSKVFRIDSDKRPNCPYCSSSVIKKNGKTRDGNQRYICLNERCGKSFSSVTKSFLSGTKKLKDYLYEMVEYTLDGLTIRNIASKLSLPITTIWTWRTKIMMMIESFIDKTTPLSKEIYSDETYIKINLKGTKKNKMPRKSYETKVRAVGQRELVCIQTLIDNTKRPVFKINGVARVSKEKLNEFIKPLILAGSVIVTDGDQAYVGFSYDNDIIHERVTDYHEKSENGYCLALINSLHSSFKFFMAKYKGVSTRRLNGYINLFVFQYVLKQILTINELNEYLYESLLDLENKITNETVKKTKYPLDIDKLFKELKNEGLLK